ncbi:hypothetical protein Patl1_25030 [Pistacia atlantica]|uniref:Uncharacterized protein n=1 Tax=Pistacia atlantica TaxID=434234 RepID=A0ACC1B4H7_9ROSI|nr:hypothetical protein Patl1_25030 [Pistacia atlantica]
MQLVENFPERTYRSMIIPIMQEDKRAGEATRKGFYLYDDKGKARPDPELKKYIEKARSVSSVAIDPKFSKLSEKDIVEMIFFSVVNEAYQVFAEGIAIKVVDLDVLSLSWGRNHVLGGLYRIQIIGGMVKAVWRIFQALCLLG